MPVHVCGENEDLQCGHRDLHKVVYHLSIYLPWSVWMVYCEGARSAAKCCEMRESSWRNIIILEGE